MDNEYGLFPLDMVVLPGEARPLHIFEPRYRQLFADCVLAARPFVVVREHGGQRADVGCATLFERLVQRLEDGRLAVIVRGLEPVSLAESVVPHGYERARCEPLRDDPAEPDAALSQEALARFHDLARVATGGEREPESVEGVPLSYSLAGAVELPGDFLQALLECRDEPTRLRMVAEALAETVTAVEAAREGQARASTNGKVPHS